ncbi:hypothetical protein [Bacillus sp. HMF5848]|nr:hypothetical protein [Bacillus sp. HMF5848]
MLGYWVITLSLSVCFFLLVGSFTLIMKLALPKRESIEIDPFPTEDC